MNQHLPQEVIAEYAETYTTVINGDFSFIAWTHAEPALARLVALGYTLREDPRVADLT